MLLSSKYNEDATRVLNALLNHISDGNRVVTVELVPSLRIDGGSVVRLEHAPGAFPSTVARGLTLAPDVLVLDPLGGEQVTDWMLGASSSPCAVIATLPASSPNDALARLVVIALEGRATDAGPIRRQLAANLDLLVHLRRGNGGSLFCAEVIEVTGVDAVGLQTATVFRTKYGPSGLEFSATGHVPALFAELSEAGEEFDTSIFNA